jgi:hypothetical protein
MFAARSPSTTSPLVSVRRTSYRQVPWRVESIFLSGRLLARERLTADIGRVDAYEASVGAEGILSACCSACQESEAHQ